VNQCSSCGGFCKKSGCERRDTISICKHFRAGITNLTAADCPYCRIDELESQMQGLSNEINDFGNTIERQKHEQVVLINLLKDAKRALQMCDLALCETAPCAFESCMQIQVESARHAEILAVNVIRNITAKLENLGAIT